jgi:hypothetical protein|tara:strand:- start:121 stop:348 length:228 start_codon:yes stop_codon:yes gene_type:complete
MADEAARFTAEHTVMEAGIEIRELKHLLVIAEDKIDKLEKENTKLKKTVEFHQLDPDLLVLDIGKRPLDKRDWNK